MEPNKEYYYYVEQYKKLYDKGYGNHVGISPTVGKKDTIGSFIKNANCKKMLDYGCGSGKQYSKLNLDKEWGIENVICYDPAIEKYSNKPEYDIDVDVILCIDVLEHIPESSVDYVLEDIFKYNSKLLIYNVSHIRAIAILPNGENCHITIKDSTWWDNKIEQHNVNDIIVKNTRKPQ